MTTTTVAITGFTSTDVDNLYVYMSIYNSGAYNCTVIGNINTTGTSITVYVQNINTTTSTCQIYWNLKYIV